MERQNNRIQLVVAGLLLGILMAAMDNTIVATAMGTIVSELGGLEKFVWVTSAYMVASVAGMPIFGKLSDMYGRKYFFIFGLIVFLIGSMLCGTSQNIIQLSIYRAVQGIGGGALMPIAFTIVYDIFPPELRGKMSGLFGAVFGTSSIFGPLLGAYITEYISWRWVFYINVPIGILSLFFIVIFYHESVEHRKQQIDWWGAITLIGSIVSLMFALELGGNQYPWNSGMITGLLSVFAILLFVFLIIESKAAEPIISFDMFKNRLFALSNGVGLFYGATFIICTVYIPIFIQGVLGGSASSSGLLLMPMMLGSVAGAQIGGFLTTRISYRNIMLVSGGLLVLGIYLLSTMTMDTTRMMVTTYMIITGVGVGFSFSVLPTAAIHGFDVRRRGSATSTNSFLRSLGMTLGISIFGIIQRNEFTKGLADAFAGSSQLPQGGDPRAVLSPEARAHIPTPILEKITGSLAFSIAETFMYSIITAILAVVFILFMGNERLQINKEKRKENKPA